MNLLTIGYMWHADLDECQVNNGNCSNLCVNIVGDYFCRCDDGYALFDGNVCLGNSHNLLVAIQIAAMWRVNGIGEECLKQPGVAR